jgi:hypothetical protein
MNFTLAGLKKKVQHSFKKKRDVRDARQLVDPLREWRMSLIITFFIACIFIVHTGLEFYRIYNDTDIPIVDGGNIPRYRGTDADLLIRFYEGREKDFETLRRSAREVAPLDLPLNEESEELAPVDSNPVAE